MADGTRKPKLFLKARDEQEAAFIWCTFLERWFLSNYAHNPSTELLCKLYKAKGNA